MLTEEQKERLRTNSKRLYNSNPQLKQEQNKTRYYNNRKRVLDHYGNKCVICGSTEDLHIDHIDGNGKEHRIAMNRRNVDNYLIANNFPHGFQVLCRKHNMMKQDMSMAEFIAECMIVAHAFEGH